MDMDIKCNKPFVTIHRQYTKGRVSKGEEVRRPLVCHQCSILCRRSILACHNGGTAW